MSGEIAKAEDSGRFSHLSPAKRWLAVAGAMAATALGGVVYHEVGDYFDKSGIVTSSDPIDPQPADIDSIHAVGSWNMHNETAERLNEIKYFAASNQLDVVALQEVNAEDFDLLKTEFQDNWYLRYVLADTKQEVTSGGFGNVLMSRQQPKDVTTLSIEGDSFDDTLTTTVASASKDIVALDSSFKNSREAMVENRAAIAFTVQAYDGNQLRDIRVMTAHIAGKRAVHGAQLQKIVEFVKENTKEDRPTVVCGDLNGIKRTVIPAFAKIGFITPITGPTAVRQHKTLDYCSYSEAGVIGLPEVTISQKYTTDHHAIVARWTLYNTD
ncbi:MAG: endonuclease/exonuclease/phosphatase family protein [Candidatus Saccharimonadales bacterium]